MAIEYPTHFNHTPITRVSTLPSGIRVATGPGNGDIATVGVWFNVGSAREIDSNFGVNNLLHKLILKGGTRDNLNGDIETLGASLTGYADRETTAFYGQSHKNDVEKFVKILGEVLGSNNIKKEELEIVRQRILNALRSKRDCWNRDTLNDHAHAAAYQGSAHAEAPVGEPDVIKFITPESIINFKNQFYSTNSLVIVGTGAVKHEQLEQLASSINLPNVHVKPYSRVDYVGSEIRIRDDTSHDVRVTFSWEAVGRSHPDFWNFVLLKVLVGQWQNDSLTATFSSSRWAESIALNKTVSTYQSHYKPYNATGLFQVYMETSPQKQDDATYLIFNEFQKLATYITPDELTRAKNQLKQSVLSQLENPEFFAKAIGETVLCTNRAISPAEYFQRIEEITVDDVQSLLATFFTDVDPVVVAQGAIEDFPDYNIIRGWTYWNRW